MAARSGRARQRQRGGEKAERTSIRIVRHRAVEESQNAMRAFLIPRRCCRVDRWLYVSKDISKAAKPSAENHVGALVGRWRLMVGAAIMSRFL